MLRKKAAHEQQWTDDITFPLFSNSTSARHLIIDDRFKQVANAYLGAKAQDGVIDRLSCVHEECR